MEEHGAVDDLNKRRALAVGRDYPDRRGVSDSDAFTEGEIGFDQGCERAVGIDLQGKVDFVAVRKLLSELAQRVPADNGGLRGEDGVAVLIAQLALAIEPAGVDRSVHAPVVEGEREVMANHGNVVFGRGLFKERVGSRAVGALQVFEVDQGDACAGGRLEGGGVVDWS